MARASTRTLVSLDRWAYHLGLEPRHFNQLYTSKAPAKVCHQPTVQYAWQNSDRVGRDDIAQAIEQAESMIVEALGYYPVPQWIAGEVVRTAPANDPMVMHGSGLINPRGLYLSVHGAFGMGISGGIKASTSIGTAVRTEPANPADTMVLTDVDGDGYLEIARITLPTTVTDVNEIRCYFPGHSQADEWEIRPLKAVTISGGNVVIDIDRHLLVDPDLWEAIDASGVDGDLSTNFILTVEIYRVYNDPSQQVQFQWERTPGQCECGDSECAMCAWAVQWGCLQNRDPRLGEWTYQPADWDAGTESFALADLSVARKPERVRLWYRAGYESSRVARPMVEMDPRFERIIMLLSATLLDRPICNCNNIEAFITRWREDRALVSEEGARYQFQTGYDHNLGCPWGTRAGAIEAFRQVERRALGGAARY